MATNKRQKKPTLNSRQLKTLMVMTPKQFIAWRKSMGLSQNDAAKALGFKHRSSICYMEKGTKAITTQTAMFCRMLKEKSQ